MDEQQKEKLGKNKRKKIVGVGWPDIAQDHCTAANKNTMLSITLLLLHTHTERLLISITPARWRVVKAQGNKDSCVPSESIEISGFFVPRLM